MHSTDSFFNERDLADYYFNLNPKKKKGDKKEDFVRVSQRFSIDLRDNSVIKMNLKKEIKPLLNNYDEELRNLEVDTEREVDHSKLKNIIEERTKSLTKYKTKLQRVPVPKSAIANFRKFNGGGSLDSLATTQSFKNTQTKRKFSLKKKFVAHRYQSDKKKYRYLRKNKANPSFFSLMTPSSSKTQNMTQTRNNFNQDQTNLDSIKIQIGNKTDR